MKGQIIVNEEVVPNVHKLVLSAPVIAKRVKPGQFVIIIPDEVGERIPLTLSDWSTDDGTITIYYQEAGVSGWIFVPRRIKGSSPNEFWRQ